MGKASRRKRERRVGSVPTKPYPATDEKRSSAVESWMPLSVVDWDSAIYETPPDRVFRFFEDPEHADALAAGNVWLSTLRDCRTKEHPLQGDAGEGVHTYHSGSWRGNGDDPEIQLVARRSGIRIEGSNVSMRGNVHVTSIPDGFVLCATESFDPGELSETFGKHCVEIENPVGFFKAVQRAFPPDSITRGVFGKVKYRERVYKGVAEEPGLIGFVKPKKYAHQREMRFLWYTSGQRLIKPFLLSVPDAAQFCKRIS